MPSSRFPLAAAFLALIVGASGLETPVSEMKEIAPGVFQIGKMRLEKATRSITFPGRVNMDKDLVEYVLVTPFGSVHESLLVSEIEPSDLHFCMLLLGANGAGLLTPQSVDEPPTQVDKEYLKRAPRLKGDNIDFLVKWKDKAGAEQSARVEDWLIHAKTNKAVPRGPWIYNGSMFGLGGGFLAQQQGTFASVIMNPAALINNPRAGNDDDGIWAVNEKAVPPVDTPVEITIKLNSGTSETK